MPNWTEDELATYLAKRRQTSLRPPQEPATLPQERRSALEPALPTKKSAKGHKFRAIPTVVDGIRFHSRKESERYAALKLLEFAGAITGLELQPRFPLIASNGEIVAHYVGDFRYKDLAVGKIVIEDVKSPITRKQLFYQLKKRWLFACHGIAITEV